MQAGSPQIVTSVLGSVSPEIRGACDVPGDAGVTVRFEGAAGATPRWSTEALAGDARTSATAKTKMTAGKAAAPYHRRLYAARRKAPRGRYVVGRWRPWKIEHSREDELNVGARTKLIAIGALTAAAIIPASAAASVKDDFGPAADVTVHPETGKATFVATEAGRALPAPTKGSPEAAAIAFLNDHARRLRPRRRRPQPGRLRGHSFRRRQLRPRAAGG